MEKKLRKQYMIKIFKWPYGEPVFIYSNSVSHPPSETLLLSLLEDVKNKGLEDIHTTIEVTEFYEVISGT
jgi:hypothetical protein